MCDWLNPVLQLFRILLSINWKGMALVTQRIVHAMQRCRSWCHISHGRRRINYLAVTRQSALIIKVSWQMHSDEFKWRLGFAFTIIIIVCSPYYATIKKFYQHWSIKPNFVKNLICMHCYAFLSDESLFTWLNCDVIGSLPYLDIELSTCLQLVLCWRDVPFSWLSKYD